jgi:hypothetical protein
MNLTPIQSSMFKAAGYDPESRRMRVQFHNGAVYEHEDVPMDKYETFIANSSPGGFYNKRIKGLHAGRKIDEEQ